MPEFKKTYQKKIYIWVREIKPRALNVRGFAFEPAGQTRNKILSISASYPAYAGKPFDIALPWD